MRERLTKFYCKTLKANNMLSLEEQIASKCIHFNGVMSKVCKAGINYADVRVDDSDGPYKFPCLQQGGQCASAEFRTHAQVKKEMAEIEDSCNKTIIAMSTIKDHIHKTKEQRGKVKCECGGELHFTVAKINGHVHANCPSCGISFME